jgi:sigma-B regulation protein RsbU (phosphoserine phosphatase)
VLFEPADELTGDYYDVLTYPDGSLLLLIADVTGHGVPAAMGAGMLKSLLQTMVDVERDPARLLSMLNSPYASVTLPEDFATVLLARYDPKARTLTYASAGHEPAYRTRSEGEPLQLSSTGTLLGVEPSASWDEETISIERGDLLVLLTDGITESFSPEGEPFGQGRLVETLRATRAGPAEAVVAEVREQLMAFRGDQPQRDDMALLVVELAP